MLASDFQLLNDISSLPVVASSMPSGLIEVNGTLFFTATTTTAGTELWKSDGTVGGTVLVKDIKSGSGGSFLGSLTNVGGTLYFYAADDFYGNELWKSDGTVGGTVLVKDIRSGVSPSFPRNLTNVDGTLYFRADDGTSGYELWKSDGTDAGTVRVKDINPGSVASSPKYLTNVGGTLYFQANDGVAGYELWKSDGTDAGTVRVKDINPGSVASSPKYLTNVGGTLYFQANDGTTGSELWKSDGTDVGTFLAKNFAIGSASGFPPQITQIGNRLFVVASTDEYGQEIWTADLTPPSLPGDYNSNGIVDAADYVVWRRTLGSTTNLQANGDNMGASANVIDQADYVVWRSNFGATSPPTGSSSSSTESDFNSTAAHVPVANSLPLAALPTSTRVTGLADLTQVGLSSSVGSQYERLSTSQSPTVSGAKIRSSSRQSSEAALLESLLAFRGHAPPSVENSWPLSIGDGATDNSFDALDAVFSTDSLFDESFARLGQLRDSQLVHSI